MNTEVIYVSGTGNTAAGGKRNFSGPSFFTERHSGTDRARTPLRRLLFHRLPGQSWHCQRRGPGFYRAHEKGGATAPAAEIRNTTRSWKTRSAPFSRTTMNTSAAFSAREKCPSGCVKNTKLCSAPSMTSWPAGSSKISMKRFFIPLLRISEKPLLLPKTSVKMTQF